MNKTNKTILAVVVVIVLIGAAVILFKPAKSSAPSSNGSTTSDNSSAAGKTVAATITYDGKTFSSSVSSVNSGDSIKVVNSSSDDLDFDSDPHPVHTDDPELNAGAIAPGQSKTFTVTKKGTWGYHNHLNSSQHGEITVK
jgi:plastocyanin